jgi:hypothetical protein
MTMVKLLEKKTLTSDVTDKIVASRHVTRSISNHIPKTKQKTLINNNSQERYIFRFRSYLVTDIGRILDAKGGFVNFLEA